MNNCDILRYNKPWRSIMPKRVYFITLDNQERSILEKTIRCGKSPARVILRANILLNSDSANGSEPKEVRELANLLHTTPTTVQNVRTEYCRLGLEQTLQRKKRENPPISPKIDGNVEAHIIALACTDPPKGYSRWTLRLLADKTIKLGIIDEISHVSVDRVLKKTNLSLI